MFYIMLPAFIEAVKINFIISIAFIFTIIFTSYVIFNYISSFKDKKIKKFGGKITKKTKNTSINSTF